MKYLRDNLSGVLSCPVSKLRLQYLSFKVVYNFICGQMDLLKSFIKYPSDKSYIKNIISISEDDLKPIHDLLELKKGLILITGHIGLWELGGIVLRLFDLPVTVITYKDKKKVLERKNALRFDAGINTIILGDNTFSSLNIVKELKSGSIIALLIDRPITKSYKVLDFMDYKSIFSTDYFLLSEISNTPVLPTFILYNSSSGKYRAVFGKPLMPSRLSDKNYREEYFHYVINLYKNIIIEYYTQWYNFHPFFMEP